jgi:5'(3')-deoxyribonucleotidase
MTTLYLDMDGVVADFDEYAARTLGVPPSEGIYPDDVWQKLAENKRIYRELNKTPYADRLVKECKDLAATKGYNFIFLTAVPKGNDIPWAFFDKVLWVQKHYAFTPVHFGPFSKDKWQHCNAGDILIDDRQSNIDEWRAAGGIAIHHVSLDSTLYELSRLY